MKRIRRKEAGWILLACMLLQGCALPGGLQQHFLPEPTDTVTQISPPTESIASPEPSMQPSAGPPEPKPEVVTSPTGSTQNDTDDSPLSTEAVEPSIFQIEAPTAVPTSSPEPTPAPPDDSFVRVKDHIPDIDVELRYATENNFTGTVIYDFSDAWLRYGTVKKLALAQEQLREQGYLLRIWDAFRPVSAQFRLWEVCPNSLYVADPRTGFSAHSRGSTVDITLLTTEGEEVPMPTGFDDFSALADRDYSDVSDPAAVANALLLEQTMAGCGFSPYYGEWWHYSDLTGYEVSTDFEPPS